MNIQLFITGIAGITAGIAGSLFLFFLANILYKKINSGKEGNSATGIFTGAVILSLVLMLRTGLMPVAEMVSQITSAGMSAGFIVSVVLRILFMFLFILATGAGSIFISFFMFSFLTREIDEMKELRKGNIAVSIVISSLCLAMSVLISPSVVSILNGIVPATGLLSGIKVSFVNFNIILPGVLNYLITIIGTVVLFFTGIKLFNVMTRGIDEIAEIKNGNLSAGFLVSSVIFALTVPLLNSLKSIGLIISFMMNRGDLSLQDLIFYKIQILLVLLCSLIFTLIVVFAGMKLYTLFTIKTNELYEIRKNNIGIAIMMSVFIVSVVFLSDKGVGDLMNSLIETPQIGRGLFIPELLK